MCVVMDSLNTMSERFSLQSPVYSLALYEIKTNLGASTAILIGIRKVLVL